MFGCACRLLVLSGTCYRILAEGILLHVSSAGCFLCWLDLTARAIDAVFFTGCPCPYTDQLYLTFLFLVTWLKLWAHREKKNSIKANIGDLVYNGPSSKASDDPAVRNRAPGRFVFIGIQLICLPEYKFAANVPQAKSGNCANVPQAKCKARGFLALDPYSATTG